MEEPFPGLLSVDEYGQLQKCRDLADSIQYHAYDSFRVRDLAFDLTNRLQSLLQGQIGRRAVMRRAE